VKPVRPADRGPAVEDIQRRLLTLGYELGPTGVDGVFLGNTLNAVREFQVAEQLSEDGVVGPQTWSRLVDATFSLGDRLLYLRFPYLHGQDVGELQGALNALGFPCGEPDRIFGAFTERAVREFQGNTGLHADGIAGSDTVRALHNLRHVWGDKDPRTPFGRRAGAARSAEILGTYPVAVVYDSEPGHAVAARLANLAQAACDGSLLVEAPADRPVPADARLVVRLTQGDLRTAAGTPLVDATTEPETLPGRVFAAVVSAAQGGAIAVLVGSDDDEHAVQRVAVGLLDGVCAALVSA
jgi:peptidoglycan hydrolase-like protein with peptidoglycan-binding domain